MSSNSLYTKLEETDKHRLAAAFIKIGDQKSFLSKVDWDKASLDFQPSGCITAASFKTSISKMKSTYNALSPSDKSRLAACFANVRDPAGLKSVMNNIDWPEAAKDYQPKGKLITGPSFKTGISRLFKKYDSSTSGTAGPTSRKRKSIAADPSPSASGSNKGRQKKAKVNQTAEAEEEDATRSTSGETREMNEAALPQPSVSSKASSPSPHIKTEDTDNATYGGDELSEEETQFFSE